jgi:hypothetical protein
MSATAPLNGRVTLAPVVPRDMAEEITLFHLALERFNAIMMQSCTWDDLCVWEQNQVREIHARLEREAHPCRTAIPLEST